MRIYLIGYMGSGKSTLGRELAKRVGCLFLDLDKYIEEKYRKTVAAIFGEEGEPAFREKEHECLVEVSQKDNVVIATGGGTPCLKNHMELMNSTGYCVFLDVDTEELADRLSKSKVERPLVKNKTSAELVDTINRMLDERRPHYEKAKYIVSGKNITVDDIVKQLSIINDKCAKRT